MELGPNNTVKGVMIAEQMTECIYWLSRLCLNYPTIMTGTFAV